jgi:hypothetical protein
MQRLGMDDRLLSESRNTIIKIIPDHICLCAFSSLAGIFNHVKAEPIKITLRHAGDMTFEWRAYL